jgi:hypothetical protein
VTTWQTDQVDIPQSISNQLGAKLVERVKVATRYVSADLEVRVAPEHILYPDYETQALPLDEAQEILKGLDHYERVTGKTGYVDRFWRRSKPWRVIVRALKPEPVPPKYTECASNEPNAFKTTTIGETVAVVRNYSAGRETIVRGGAVQVTDLPAMTVITVWKEGR